MHASGHYCGIFWSHFDTPETEDEVNFESEGGGN